MLRTLNGKSNKILKFYKMQNYLNTLENPKLTILPAIVTSICFAGERFYIKQSNYKSINTVLFTTAFCPTRIEATDEAVALFIITPKRYEEEDNYDPNPDIEQFIQDRIDREGGNQL